MSPKCIAAILCMCLVSCSGDAPMPLPMGYFRIDTPENQYKPSITSCPFSFGHSTQARLEFFDQGKGGDKCWFDAYYPNFKARIHFTYKNLDGNLREFIEESRALTYEHHIKASRIKSELISRDEARVFGLIYQLDGNVASPFQFYLTDSVHHFLRGSVYVEAKPNQDSIQPVLQFIKADIEHLAKSLEWQ